MTDKIDDKEFAEFLKIARKETLTEDDSHKLQDALKKHPQWLKDQTKTDQMFPQPVMKRNKDGQLEAMTPTEACGLEKTDCMRNVISAAVALNKEKDQNGESVLSDEALGNFMNTTDSRTGRNFATVVARNMKGCEIKSKKASSQTYKDALDNNLQGLEQTMEVINAAAPDLKNTKDGNAITASKYIGNAQEETQEQPQEQTETYQIGGTANELVVKPQKQDLNVKAEEEDKTADIQQAEEEDPGKKQPLKFSPVEEQDIIKYMFNAWFLAGINYCMEKIYNWGNDAVDWLSRPYQPAKVKATATAAPAPAPAPTPTPTQTPTPTPTPTSRSQQNANQQTPDAATMFDNFNRVIDSLTFDNKDVQTKCNLIIEDLKNNVGTNKKPQDWKTTVLDPKKDAEFMKACTQLYNKDPQAFEARLQDKSKLLGTIAPLFIGEIRTAATIAVMEHASNPKNFGKPIDEEAKTAILGRTKLLLKDMNKTREILGQKYESEYRADKKLDPDVPLSDEAIKSIQNKVGQDYGRQINTLAENTIKTRDLLAQYYDADNKEAVTGPLSTARKNMIESINNLGNIPQDNNEQNKAQKQTDNRQPQDLRTEAIETNKAERFEQRMNSESTRRQEALTNDKSQNNQRKNKVKGKLKQGYTTLKDWFKNKVKQKRSRAD